MARHPAPSMIETCSATPPEAPAVVLVHGLWLGAWAMVWLARRLAMRGLRVFRFGYPSVSAGLAENADALRRFSARIEAPVVHWVGHSLGGILIFQALTGSVCPQGRVVMLGTPFGGSDAATRLARWQAGRRLLGASLAGWLAAPQAAWTLPNELGVVSGTRSIGLGRFIAPLPRPNDGVVSLAETGVAGAKESVALPVCHAGMLTSEAVARYAAGFLLEGRFPAGTSA